MPVLSLIGCKILEDEITHVLSEHREKSRIIIVDDLESMDIAKKLRTLNIPFSKAPIDRVEGLLGNAGKSSGSNFLSRIFGSKSDSDLVIIVKIMELSLHRDHHLLRNTVEQQITDMARYSDGIFLFYGLCGNSLKGIEKIAEELECEVYVPTDRDGEVVDDCISIAVGGNRVYSELFEQCSGTGTLFFTPMWAAKWDFTGEITTDFVEKIGRVVQLDTGLQFEREFSENIFRFSKLFNTEIMKMEGSTDIIDASYLKAKDEVLARCRNKVS